MEPVRQGDQERPHVGRLDQDGQVGRQVPPLGHLGDDERKLHPQTVDGHPGAHPEEAGQQVCEQGHGLQPNTTSSPPRARPGPEGLQQVFGPDRSKDLLKILRSSFY